MASPRLSIDGREVAAVFAGGVAGTIARAALAETLVHDAGQWPWATFIVNVAAAAALGWVVTRHEHRPSLSSYHRPLVGTGLCGGLSTFATVQLELVDMVDAGHAALAAEYAGTSVAAGLLAVTLATAVTRRTGRAA